MDEANKKALSLSLYLSLSISNQPPCPQIMPVNGWWCSIPEHRLEGHYSSPLNVVSCFESLIFPVPVPFHLYSAAPLLSNSDISVLSSLSPSPSAYPVLSATLISSLPEFILTCFHHRHVTHAPDCCSAARHSFSIGRVAISWATVLWRRRTYVSTSSNPTYIIAASIGD